MFNHASGFQNAVGGVRWNHNPQACIYFFSPQQMPELCVRPTHYMFNFETVGEINNIIDRNLHSNAASIGGEGIKESVANSLTLNQAIKPAMHGTAFDTTTYQEYWTFLLIMDNAPMMGRAVGATQSNRIMYIGFVMGDVPVFSQNGRTVLNDSAILMPTHKTHLNIREVSGLRGSLTTFCAQMDEDVVSPGLLKMTTPDRKFVMEPKELLVASFTDGYGNSVEAPGLLDVTQKNHNIRFDTRRNNPTGQLQQLVSGLTRMRALDAGDREIRSDHRETAVNMHDYTTSKTVLLNSLGKALPDVLVGLQVNQPIQFGDLLREYPSLVNKIEVIKLPFPVQADALYMGDPTPTNIWSSLIQSTLPSIASYFGLADVAFRYCSCNPGSISSLDNQPMWEVSNISTFMPMETDALKMRWERTLEHLQNQIFSIIIANCGNFDVTVNFSANNYCMVQLQLMDIMDVANNGFAVSHGVVSPLASPMIGTSFDREANSQQLNGLFDYINVGSY